MSAIPLVPHSLSLPGRPRLQCLAQGDPAGLPVLLLHGYGDTHRAYEPLLACLPPALRVLAPTQRGHGHAEACTDYSPAAMAGDAVALLEAHRHEAAVVVGHSMGCSVALRMALRAPERVLGLVLIGAFATMRDKPDITGLAADLARLRDPVDRAFVTEFQASMLAAPLPDEYFTMLVDESCKMPAHAWREVLRGMLADEHKEADLRRIAVPTLLVWGDRDAYALRGDQQALQASLRSSRLVVHAGRGHCPHWEDPAAVAAEITAFVEALRAGGGRQRPNATR